MSWQLLAQQSHHVLFSVALTHRLDQLSLLLLTVFAAMASSILALETLFLSFGAENFFDPPTLHCDHVTALRHTKGFSETTEMIELSARRMLERFEPRRVQEI